MTQAARVARAERDIRWSNAWRLAALWAPTLRQSQIAHARADAAIQRMRIGYPEEGETRGDTRGVSPDIRCLASYGGK